MARTDGDIRLTVSQMSMCIYPYIAMRFCRKIDMQTAALILHIDCSLVWLTVCPLLLAALEESGHIRALPLFGRPGLRHYHHSSSLDFGSSYLTALRGLILLSIFLLCRIFHFPICTSVSSLELNLDQWLKRMDLTQALNNAGIGAMSWRQSMFCCI